MVGQRVGLVAVVVGAALGAWAPAAGAWWEAAPSLAMSTELRSPTVLATGDDGTVAVGFVRDEHGEYTFEVAVKRPGASAFGAARRLGGTVTTAPALAVGRDGTVLAVWHDGERGPTAALAPPGGGFGAERLIDALSNSSFPKPFLADDGTATVVYQRGDGSLSAATAPPGGGAWTAGDIPDSVRAFNGAQAAVAPNGDAVVTWRIAAGYPDYRVMISRRVGPTGAFSAPATLSDADDVDVTSIAAGPAGRFAILLGARLARPQLFLREPGGPFAQVDLPYAEERAATPSYVGDDLRLVDADWDGTQEHVIVHDRHRGTWLPAQAVGDVAEITEGLGPYVVTSPAGAPMTIWGGRDPRTEQLGLVSATRRSDGTWPAVHGVSTGGYQGRFTIARSGQGRTAVSWSWWDGHVWRVSVAEPDDRPDPVTPHVLRAARPVLPPAQSATTSAQSDPSHTGRLVGAGVGPTLTPAWTAHTGAGDSRPVLVGDEVVTAFYDADADVSGVAAYDLETGRERWRQTYPSGIRGPFLIATDAGRVFVAVDSSLRAFDPGDGHELWNASISQYVPTSLFAHDGRVYLAAVGVGSTAFVHDAATGAFLFRGVAGGGSMTEAGDQLVGVGACGRAVWWDRATGQDLWRHDTECSGGGSYRGSFDGGWLWTEESPHGWIFDNATHEVIARVPGTVPSFSRALAVNIEDGELVARDNQTLDVVWRFAGNRNLRTNPLIVDGTVLVAGWGDELYAVDLASGRETWRGALPPTWFFYSTMDLANLAAGRGHVVVPLLDGIQVLRSTSEPVPDVGAPAVDSGDGGSSAPASVTQDPMPTGTPVAPAAAGEPAHPPPGAPRATAPRVPVRHVRLGTLRRHGLTFTATVPSTGARVRGLARDAGREVAQKRWTLKAGGARTLHLPLAARRLHAGHTLELRVDVVRRSRRTVAVERVLVMP